MLLSVFYLIQQAVPWAVALLKFISTAILIQIKLIQTLKVAAIQRLLPQASLWFALKSAINSLLMFKPPSGGFYLPSRDSGCGLLRGSMDGALDAKHTG